APREMIRAAMERSVRWAKRCRDRADHPYQSLFAIVQGGLEPDLRLECVERLAELDFPGYAIGGLSVGESPEEMVRLLEVVCPAMPATKPRYLMGVGRPQDLIEAIRCGVDMFDCVMPTRNGRNAMAFTTDGPIRLRNQCHRTDDGPIEPGCPCMACHRPDGGYFSRGYLRHLFMAEEMLAPILVTHHNLTYYQRLMAGARDAIERGQFAAFRDQCYRRWRTEPARP
ncbi:MAG: tRNA guanosine(34) transglycosylase Tgt, partial [Planctomycetia bacterium]|nr:tRNA guanosine(34) transglycosylase Tgt [Planctomycetia bacterium]